MTTNVTCKACRKSFDRRQLHTVTTVTESCPFCKEILSQGESMSGSNPVAAIVGDISEIESWLNNYQQNNSIECKKLDNVSNEKHRWAVSASSDFAIQIVYDEKHFGFVSVEGITKKGANKVHSQPENFLQLVASFGLQPVGTREQGWDIEMGAFKDYSWGVNQYLNTHNLSVQLLKSTIDRIVQAMLEITNQLALDSDE